MAYLCIKWTSNPHTRRVMIFRNIANVAGYLFICKLHSAVTLQYSVHAVSYTECMLPIMVRYVTIVLPVGESVMLHYVTVCYALLRYVNLCYAILYCYAM